MLIQGFRAEQSTIDEADNLFVQLLLDTPKGKAFVPVAIVEDSPGPRALHKALFAGLPATQNIIRVAKDELEVWSQGNNIFVGWTVQIPLLPLPYNLPPSSMILEGHGSPRIRTYTVNFPSGYKTIVKSNEFEAFATFVNTSWKYAGPATDGALTTDAFVITTPPKNKQEGTGN
jgi:hypothetical protein